MRRKALRDALNGHTPYLKPQIWQGSSLGPPVPRVTRHLEPGLPSLLRVSERQVIFLYILSHPTCNTLRLSLYVRSIEQSRPMARAHACARVCQNSIQNISMHNERGSGLRVVKEPQRQARAKGPAVSRMAKTWIRVGRRRASQADSGRRQRRPVT